MEYIIIRPFDNDNFRRIQLNIGLIGAGAIGTYLLEELNGKNNQDLHITAVYVRNKEKYSHLEKTYNVNVFTNMDEFLKSGIDIVVESANVETVRDLLEIIVKEKDIVLISIGALADTEFLNQIQSILNTYDTQIHLPSGAIGGLDLIQNSAAVGIIHKVNLVTRKPAHTLVAEKILEAKIVFEGKATEAIERYPKNMNVSIALALAGIGFKQTKVTLIADPTIKENIHRIEVEGEFGSFVSEIKNKPLPSNPNTSYLAAVSIVGTLKKMTKNIQIG